MQFWFPMYMMLWPSLLTSPLYPARLFPRTLYSYCLAFWLAVYLLKQKWHSKHMTFWIEHCNLTLLQHHDRLQSKQSCHRSIRAVQLLKMRPGKKKKKKHITPGRECSVLCQAAQNHVHMINWLRIQLLLSDILTLSSCCQFTLRKLIWGTFTVCLWQCVTILSVLT